MKKKLIIVVVMIVSLLMISGCNNKNIINGADKMISNINVTINDKDYILNLEDNSTVGEFINLLPLEFTMNELNGNEKYVYMDNTLTTNTYTPKHIDKGDVMLFGNDCLVIFYKSFDTSYSYTKIGHINNLDDLDNGNIFVKFNN